MEKDIIQLALDNLRQTTDIQAVWRAEGPLNGWLEWKMEGQSYSYVSEIKKEVRPHQLQQIALHHREYEAYILIAHRIFPKVKDALRQQGIAYLEVNGNIFIKKGLLFLFVDTQKAIPTVKTKANRAFTKTGLKVVFYLLQNRDHIHLTQRELAEKTDVGLGNIPQVLEGLKETGYLIPLNHRTYVWDKRRELLERWVIEYGTVLKPKLKQGRYDYQGNWNDIQFNPALTVWGGEPAADILTDYLRPETYIVYTRENRADLMRNYRLIPKESGAIEALELFWKQDAAHQTAPPILVYADLLLEGGKRNTETAEKIFDAYIQPNL